jgi:hypothetical protein
MRDFTDFHHQILDSILEIFWLFFSEITLIIIKIKGFQETEYMINI